MENGRGIPKCDRRVHRTKGVSKKKEETIKVTKVSYIEKTRSFLDSL